MKPLATHAAPVTPSRHGGAKREILKNLFHEIIHVFSSVPSGPSINLHFVDVDKQVITKMSRQDKDGDMVARSEFFSTIHLWHPKY